MAAAEFEFTTNAPEVVAQITAALAQLRTELDSNTNEGGGAAAPTAEPLITEITRIAEQVQTALREAQAKIGSGFEAMARQAATSGSPINLEEGVGALQRQLADQAFAALEGVRAGFSTFGESTRQLLGPQKFQELAANAQQNVVNEAQQALSVYPRLVGDILRGASLKTTGVYDPTANFAASQLESQAAKPIPINESVAIRDQVIQEAQSQAAQLQGEAAAAGESAQQAVQGAQSTIRSIGEAFGRLASKLEEGFGEKAQNVDFADISTFLQAGGLPGETERARQLRPNQYYLPQLAQPGESPFFQYTPAQDTKDAVYPPNLTRISDEETITALRPLVQQYAQQDALLNQRQADQLSSAQLAAQLLGGAGDSSRVGQSSFFRTPLTDTGFAQLATSGVSAQEVEAEHEGLRRAQAQEEQASQRSAQAAEKRAQLSEEQVTAQRVLAEYTAGEANRLGDSRVFTGSFGAAQLSADFTRGQVLPENSFTVQQLQAQQDLVDRQRQAAALIQSGQAEQLGSTPFYKGLPPELAGNDQGIVQLLAGGDRANLDLPATKIRQATDEMERLNRAANQPNGISGFFQGALGGFGGRGFGNGKPFDINNLLPNLGYTAGDLARYNIQGQLANVAITGISDSVKGAVELQSALVDLNQLTRATGAGQLDLGSAFQVAAQYGLNEVEAVRIGTQAIGAYGNEIRNGADASQVFVQSIKSAGEAALLTGEQAGQAADQLIAVTQGFGTGVGGQSQVLDALQAAFTSFGTPRGDTLQALAQIPGLLNVSGFNPQQSADLVGLISRDTSLSPETVASNLQRVLGKGGSSTFLNALSGLGVAPGSLNQELAQASQVLPTLGQTGQQQLYAALGNPRDAQVLIDLLQHYKELQQADSRPDLGTGEQAALQQQESLRGQLKQLGADAKNVGIEIAQSGILDAIGLMVKAIDPLLSAVSGLLGVLGSVPKPLRDIAFGALEAVAALRLFASTELRSAVAGVVPFLAGPLGVAGGSAATAATAGAAASGAAVDTVATSAAIDTELAATAAAAGASAAEVEAALASVDASLQATAEVAVAASGEIDAANVAQGAGGAGGLAGRLGGLGGALGGALPALAIFGGIEAFGSLRSSFDKQDTNLASAQTALGQLNNATSLSQFQAAQSALSSAMVDLNHSSSGLTGSFTNLFESSDQTRTALQQDLNYAQARIDALTAEQSALDSVSSSTSKFAVDLSQLDQSIKNIQDKGGTASDALFGSPTQGGGAIPALIDQVQAQPASRAVSSLIAGAGGEAGKGTDTVKADVIQTVTDYFNNTRGDVGSGKFTGPDFAAELKLGGVLGIASDNIPQGKPLADPKKFADAVDQAEQQSGLSAGQGIRQTDLLPLARRVVDNLGLKDLPKGIHDALVLSISQNSDLLSLTEPTTRSSADIQRAFQSKFGPEISSILKQIPQAISDFNPLTAGGDVKQAEAALGQLRQLQTNVGGTGNFDELDLQIQQLEAKITTDKIKQIDAVLQAETRGDKNQARVANEALTAMRDKAIAAGQFDDVSAMIDAINASGDVSIGALEASLRTAETVAEQAAIVAQKEIQVAIAAIARLEAASGGLGNLLVSAGIGGILNLFGAGSTTSFDTILQLGQGVGQLVASEGQIQGVVNALKVTQQAVQSGLAAGSGINGIGPFPSTGGSTAKPSAPAYESLPGAIAAAEAYPGSKIDQANAAIVKARDDLAHDQKNTVKYFQDLAALNRAQYDLATAVIDATGVIDQLHLDLTDPVQVALDKVRTAYLRLQVDRHKGAPPDVINADQLALTEAQTSYAKTQFDQRLQDAKTAHDLQQTSDAAYLQFLETQHNHLTAIKSKTRQQIDELNQVDQLILEASKSLEAQFNLGDIRLPSVYEVRQAIQAGAKSVASLVQDYSTNNFYIQAPTPQAAAFAVAASRTSASSGRKY